MTFSTVCIWVQKLNAGVESVKTAPKSGRPKSASSPRIVANMVEISEVSVLRILRNSLKLKKKIARRIPHFLTEEQKRTRVKMARKRFEKVSKIQYKDLNVVTSDETLIHFLKPHQRFSNPVRLTKDAKRPCIAKWIASVQKRIYAVFGITKEIAIKVFVHKGKSVYARIKKNLRKLSYYSRNFVQRGIRGMYLLHGNASGHKPGSVTSFLNEQGVMGAIIFSNIRPILTI